MFRRDVSPSTINPAVLVDSRLANSEYVGSFGFEWSQIDGFAGKEVMSHGHVFGRFMLPSDFFDGKTVLDVGCGNGRIGRLIAPLAKAYVGIDLSEAIYSFPLYIKRPETFALVQASGTDLPVSDATADVTVCWGVLHHMDQPERGLSELLRVTKPGGTILLFVYPQSLDIRKNLNAYMRGIEATKLHDIVSRLSDAIDSWREVDHYYGELLGNFLCLSFKHSREWQKFQWFDGISPQFHWSLEKRVEEWAAQMALSSLKFQPGCFRLTTKAA